MNSILRAILYAAVEVGAALVKKRLNGDDAQPRAKAKKAAKKAKKTSRTEKDTDQK